MTKSKCKTKNIFNLIEIPIFGCVKYVLVKQVNFANVAGSKSCHEVIVVITGRTHYFHDYYAIYRLRKNIQFKIKE